MVSAAGSSSSDDCVFAPCSAGSYMTESGCQQCGENSFSADGASSCTSCPEDMVSAAGSSSPDDCVFAPCSAGSYMTKRGCQQCGENSFSAAGASSCTSCPDDMVSAAGSTSQNDCDFKHYPTCDCWTAKCGFCSSLECTVEHDLANSNRGIVVSSRPNLRTFDTIFLYDGDGVLLGQFTWNLKGISLSGGCVKCGTPPALRKARNRKGQTSWIFSLTNGVLQIKIGDKVFYEK